MPPLPPPSNTMTLIRASVQGIVFLIDSVKGRVYTYNPERPIYVGNLERIPEEDKHSISKTNGCMATARVCYRPDIREVMAAERLTHKIESTSCMGDAENTKHGITPAPTPAAIA
jgi:hypothetical protein